jgi:hypothetical protein
MRIAFLLLSLLFAAAAPAAFDASEVPKDGVAYRLSFCARAFPDSALGIPPHAFLALNTVDPAQKRVFHAVGTVRGVQPRALLGHAAMLTPVPAALSTPDYGALMQNCLVVPVSRAEYQVAERLVVGQVEQMALTIPKADIYGVYGLAPEDCSALFVKVLKSLSKKGLLVPKQFPSEPPIGYLRRLIDQNLRPAA